MGRDLHFVSSDATRNEIGEMAIKALQSYLSSGSQDSLDRAVELVATLKRMEQEIEKLR